jgi:hypothetical protein
MKNKNNCNLKLIKDMTIKIRIKSINNKMITRMKVYRTVTMINLDTTIKKYSIFDQV